MKPRTKPGRAPEPSPKATSKPRARPLPTRLSGPGASPGFLLWKVSNAWQRRQRAALQPLGLTHSQFVILAASTWFGATETLTQSRIAELTGIDVMTTSQVLRTLEAAQLLERREHPDDPRAKSIDVTSRGRALAGKAIVVVEDTDTAFFAPIAAHTPELLELFGHLASGAEATSEEDSTQESAEPSKGKRKKA